MSVRDGSTLLGTVTLSTTGTASFSTSSLAHGAHSITVAYLGNSNYTASISAAEQFVVQLAQPTLTLIGPANPVDAGTMASFTAALTSPGVSPTGTLMSPRWQFHHRHSRHLRRRQLCLFDRGVEHRNTHAQRKLWRRCKQQYRNFSKCHRGGSPGKFQYAPDCQRQIRLPWAMP